MDKFFFDSEENIASFMESFPSIVLILDADDGDILGCNEAAVSFYGYAREELLSRSIFDFNCLFKEEVLNRIKKAKQKNQSFFRFRHRISSGDLKDVEVYSVPITFKGKSRMFSMIRDISETVVASRQLEEKTKQLNCFHRLFRIFEEVCDDFDLLCRQVESAVRDAMPFSDRCRVTAHIGDIGQGLIDVSYDRCVGTYSIPGRLSAFIEVSLPKQADQVGSVFRDQERKLIFMAAEGLARYLERVTIMEELRTSKERTEKYLSMAGAFFLVLDVRGIIVEINEKGASILGYPRESLLGRSWFDIAIPKEDKDQVREYLQSLSQENSDFKEKVKSKVCIFGGDSRTLRWNNSLIRNSAGEVKEVLSIGMDVTDEVNAVKKVEKLTFIDPLTDLFNRNYMEKIKETFFVQENLPIGIVMGDVNGLKLTNDAFGHAAGDAILKKTGAILKSACRDKDVVIRWGGDEFIVLFPHTDWQIMSKISSRIEDCFARSGDKLAKDSLAPSLTIGTSVMSDLEEGFERVLKKAEDMMYQKKVLAGASRRSSILGSLESVLREKTFETTDHIMRITVLSRFFARVLEMSQEETEKLELLARLHDIGLISVPSELLMKKGPLDTSEWAVVKGHPEVGYRIARAISSETISVSEAILSHHERWDGEGYPNRSKGEHIPRLSRILSILDTFEAITNDRPYRKTRSSQEALEEIDRCSGFQFDPDLVASFISMMKEDLP